LLTSLLSCVSVRARICPSTKLTTWLCQLRSRMGVGSFLCLCGMVPTDRMQPWIRNYHRPFIICTVLIFIVCSLAVHYTHDRAPIKISGRYMWCSKCVVYEFKGLEN
jgi:hypothetical protein